MRPHTKECSCGTVIEFAINKGTGSKIPLDTRIEVYRVVAPATDTEAALVERDPDAKVSHFRVCPHAANFSRPPKLKPTPPRGKELAAGPDDA